jgi:valyl-tRNA synthetase
MSELPKAYEAKDYEDQIYKIWEASGAFQPRVDAKAPAFSISMPPPNATGTLHLGHSVMLALQDIMIRYRRMNGASALLLPGTDHAAIATQSKVEQVLAENGKTRIDLGREVFLEKVKEFVADSQQTIRNQVRKMGTSCDWTREKYTMDESLNTAVNEFFRRLYSDGIIYRGDRIVNWDPNMQTTVADDEVEHDEKTGTLYHIQYGPLVVATSRPETKLGDTAVAVNPTDKRWKKYIGQTIEVKFPKGHTIQVPVIADKTVDPKFGSGALGVTPAHSQVDFDMAEKNKISKPQVIDFEGKMTSLAGPYAGMNLFVCRKKLVADMEAEGMIVKKEEYNQSVAVNYRGKGVIEPQVMKQWFVDVNKKTIDWKGKQRSLKEVMQDTVKSGDIKIIPDKFEKIYFHWIDNLRDWCISRQIWWGHQIPIWYKVSKADAKKWYDSKEKSSYLLQSLGIEVLETVFSDTNPASDDIPQGSSRLLKAPQGSYWIRDPDTLDTWFSSALWTFSTLGWPEKTADLKRFHPTGVMETGYDILFFWVARMILASTYCLRSDGLPEEQCLPFKTVYLHGLVRDRNGKKMSKSNPETTIDPLDMIAKYGTDALRLSLFIGSTPGNDSRLYEEKISGYRNFVNKLWNVARFSLMNIDLKKLSQKDRSSVPKTQTLSDEWILSRLHKLIQDTSTRIEKYSFSEAAEELYKFTWMELADWYLEIAKIEGNKDAILYYILKKILKLWHPFTPFVTEVLWKELENGELLIESPWPKFEKTLISKKAESDFAIIQEVITTIRNLRAESQVEPAKLITTLIVSKKHQKVLEAGSEILKRLARIENLSIISEVKDKPEKTLSKFLDGIEIYIPLEGLKNPEEEKLRLEKELQELEKYCAILATKLKNKAFVDHAPKNIVELEKNKYTEATEKLKKIQDQLKSL